MKFLCEQCKAKYQIADEKVAGKTVRMKCRKCGFLIEVKAEVTETSVAKAMPKGPPDDKTKVAMPNVTDSARRTPIPAKPGTLPRPAAPKPAPKGGALATSLASAKPAPKPAPKQEGALAGAFQKQVQKDDLGMLEMSTSLEWYCAINGVPVGPVRMSELRRKAASGAVTEDSLVWQEGMEEWQPVRTITELAEIVREAAASGRPSLTPAPGEGRASTPSPLRALTPAAAAPPSRRPSDHRGLAPAARSNVVPITSSRLATAERIDEADLVPPSGHPDPFAVPDRVSSAGLSPVQPVAPVLGVDATQPRKQTNFIGIGIVGLFIAFGATAGFAFFFRQPQTIVVQPAAPQTVTVNANDPHAANTTADTSQHPLAAASNDPVKTPTGVGGGTGGGHTTAAGSASTKAVDPSIAALLGNMGGPTVGPQTGGGTATSALSEDAIQKVVRDRTPGVKRTCWERGGSQLGSVNVKVKLMISAAGNVSSADAEGNDPIVTKCIENSVKTWTFPVSSGTTTVEIPFHFLRQ